MEFVRFVLDVYELGDASDWDVFWGTLVFFFRSNVIVK